MARPVAADQDPGHPADPRQDRNVEKARLDRSQNTEVQAIISALGTGVRGLRHRQARYHKIIMMADADVDGAHIRTLLLT